MNLLEKQEHAVYYLKDSTTKEILYGGAAGGGKSAIGCLWLIEMCQTYPETRWLMGRAKAKTLKETTLNTFFELTKKFDIQDQYEYKEQKGLIKWNNDSEILLKDLFYYPSDPDFNELGSLEITGAFIDECNQIVKKAWNIVKSRIRYKLKEYNLMPKLLGTCNPSQTWVYSEFYKPNQNGTLKNTKKFIQALPKDNPHLPLSYMESLLDLDENSKQRLYYGNWDYDSDPSKLVEYDSICDMFTNDHVPKGDKSISTDLAMQGRDKYLAGLWSGLRCTVAIDEDKSTGRGIELSLKELKTNNSVPNSRIVADSDGLGNYLESYIKNIKEFRGGADAKDKKIYDNIKSECAWMLARKIEKREIYIVCSPEQEEAIKKEISVCLKRDNTDSDTQKKKLIPKKKMKELLGHSPDYLDMLIMGMFNEVYRDDLVFNQNDCKTYSAIPEDHIKDSEVIAFVRIQNKEDSMFSMPIVRINKENVYLEEALFSSDDDILSMVDSVCKMNDKYGFSQIIVESDKDSLIFKTKLLNRLEGVQVYGQWINNNTTSLILSYSGIVKNGFRFPEKPTPQTDLFMNQVYRFIKGDSAYHAPYSITALAAHLESHYGMFKE